MGNRRRDAQTPARRDRWSVISSVFPECQVARPRPPHATLPQHRSLAALLAAPPTKQPQQLRSHKNQAQPWESSARAPEKLRKSFWGGLKEARESPRTGSQVSAGRFFFWLRFVLVASWLLRLLGRSVWSPPPAGHTRRPPCHSELECKQAVPLSAVG